MIGSIGKLAGGITGKSKGGITDGALGLANDITGLAGSKKSKAAGKAKGGGKAAILQQILSAITAAKG